MRKSFPVTAVALLIVVGALALAQPGGRRGTSEQEPREVPQEAVVVLSATQGHDARGVLILKQESNGVRITGTVSGLEPGEHGFHIHEFGDLRAPDGKSAGGHFNPTSQPHGQPGAGPHHLGDLGNITANAQGQAEVDTLAAGLELHFVIGRALVVHGEADDFSSQPAGDAGTRVGLGVIGFAEVAASPGQ